MTAGSPLWQTIFVSFALVLILFEVVRGWRLGLLRQTVRLFAFIAAYAVALFGARMLLPLLRPFLLLPDLILSILAASILGLIVYAIINTIGAVLFKKTAQQDSGLVRLVYGVCGAVLGMFFGLFSVWLTVVAIRSAGAIANAELRQQAAVKPHPSTAVIAPPRPTPAPSAPPIVVSLAKLNNSIELGSLGATVMAVDVVPAQTYQTLGKVGTVVSNPTSAERFLSYPGARDLTQNPRIVALRGDPEIIELLRQQYFLDLLQNPKLIAAMNDPVLGAKVRSFEFQKALDYALRR